MALPLNQTYLPKDVCWNQRSIQQATVMAGIITAFMRRHTHCRVFAGFGAQGHVENSDHICGLASDIVPLLQDAAGKAALEAAEADAKALGAVYTDIEWTDSNKHLHVSWARCPRTT